MVHDSQLLRRILAAATVLAPARSSRAVVKMQGILALTEKAPWVYHEEKLVNKWIK